MSIEKKKEEPKTLAPLDFDKEFELDEDKAAEGAWMPYKHARLRVTFTGYRTVANHINEYNRKYQTEEAAETPEADAEWVELLAEHVLVGWEGFSVPYSPTEAARVLGHQILRAKVLTFANNYRNFQPGDVLGN